MFKKIFLFNFLVIFSLIFFINKTEAATFELSPNSGSLSVMGGVGCNKTIDIFINVPTESTNGAQIYIEHNFVASGESLSISSGGLFSTYKTLDILPDPLTPGNKVVGYLGYGGTKTGSNLRFARLTLKTNKLLETKRLIIRFGSEEIITSKIADGVTSENILVDVNNANYSVQSGFCETLAPQIINVNPANQKPNHKVSDPITFQVSDSGGSGVDIATLVILLNQDAWTGNFSVSTNKINDNLYSVSVDQDTAFIPERKVTWSVSVSDKAGNNTSGNYYFNDLSCAELGCTGGEVLFACGDGKDNDGDKLIDEQDLGCLTDGVYDPTKDREYDDNLSCPVCDIIYNCSDGIDNDGDGLVDSQDQGCLTGGVYNPTDNNEYIAECNDGIDNDGDSLIDYPSDSGCTSYDDNNETNSDDCGGVSPDFVQCNDGIDNDGDGLIDMADLGCLDSSDNNEFVIGDLLNSIEYEKLIEYLREIESEYIILPQCADGIDNDGDGLIDFPSDSDCENIEDNSEYHLPVGAVLTNKDIRILLNNKTIISRLNSQNSIDVLVLSPITVAVDTSKITETIKSATLYFKDTSYKLYFDQSLKMYVADILAPSTANSFSAIIKIEHGEDGEEILPFNIFALPYGKVMGQVETDFLEIPDAIVTLEQLSSDNKYKLIRSIETDQNGLYGFMAPNGAYKITIKKDGYLVAETSGFNVDNFIINRNLNLIKKIDLLDPEIPLTEKVTYVANVGLGAVNTFVDSRNDPKIENTVEKVVAPLAIATTLAMAVPALSLLSLFTYLRILVLFPFTFFARKKRKEWGVVYNSLTKMPIDLITVRLIDDKTDRIVQTAVTDIKGRYKFFAESGTYRIVVASADFIYPTKILQDVAEDTSFENIYHGAPIHIDDKTSAIIQNIPIDPVGVNKTPKRIIFNSFVHEIRSFIITSSLVVGIIAMFIKPNLYIGILLAVQLLFYVLFKKATKQTKFKNYGVIFENKTKKAIAKAVVRLYDSKFNRLIATQVTDNNGRYSFLVGKNNYYLTIEKLGYNTRKIDNINVIEKDDGVVDKDISLEKIVKQKESKDKNKKIVNKK